jgi:hypothetical protein
MFKPHTNALLFVGKGIHGNGKQFLAFEHYLIFVYPSILPSKIHGITRLKCLNNDLRAGAIEIDYK